MPCSVQVVSLVSVNMSHHCHYHHASGVRKIVSHTAGSARGSIRQDSESGDRIQAMMDEAVEAATEAAAAAAAAAAGSEDMDKASAAVSSDSGLRERDGNDSLLRGSSPEAATAVPISQSPYRQTTPPTRLTPPPADLDLGSQDIGWGLADKLR